MATSSGSGGGSTSTVSGCSSSCSGTQRFSVPRVAPHTKAVEQCGLLTVNRHRFALECDKLADIRTAETASKNPARKPSPPRSPAINVSRLKTLKRKKRKSGRGEKDSHPVAPKAERIPDSISICTVHSRYEIIGVVARQLGWRCSRDQEHCNVLWTDSIMGVETCRYMRRFQKINHFPGMFEICRKDLLARNMNRMLKLFPKEYQIFPKTWHLPADYGDAVQFARSHRQRTYILKPDQGAQGRGISLTRTLKDVSPTEHIICQLYISRPLLIDGFKFDLRVYTLITCIDPLRVYVYNEGLARFATSPYREPKGHNTTNMYMHLTNYSVNKHSRTYSKDDEVGSKRRFSTLNRILSSEGYDVVGLWNNIDDVVIKTIVSAWPVLRHNYTASFPSHDIQHACFEILGVDIIIDQNLKPWLLEVNHSPSFHTDGPVDKEVKHALIRDTFTMLNVQPADKRRVVEEDKRRVNNRLLRRIKEFRTSGVSGGPQPAAMLAATQLSATTQLLSGASSTTGSTAELGGGQKPATARRCPWLAQIEWEETHMGGFRRVLPVPGDPDKYTVFLDRQNNQASVFGETVASKKREEEAKQQRASLAERERFPVVVKTFGKLAGNGQLDSASVVADADEERVALKRKRAALRMRRNVNAIVDGFRMEPVAEAEERERVAQMQQRDFLVRSCGVRQYIYLGFYRNNLLTDVELRQYEELHPTEMDASFERLHQERKLRLKSLAVIGANTLNM